MGNLNAQDVDQNVAQDDEIVVDVASHAYLLHTFPEYARLDASGHPIIEKIVFSPDATYPIFSETASKAPLGGDFDKKSHIDLRPACMTLLHVDEEFVGRLGDWNGINRMTCPVLQNSMDEFIRSAPHANGSIG